MQKKLHLAVLALFVATTAFAQEPKTTVVTEEEQAVLNEQAFTFTEAQLGEDDDMS